MALAIVFGCSNPKAAPKIPSAVQNNHNDVQNKPHANEIPVPKLPVNLQKSQLQFSFDLLHTLLEASSGKNVLISPLSIYTALSMTYNGAGGSTKQAMEKALRLEQNSDVTQFNKSNAELIHWLSAKRKNIELSIANSLWMKDGFEFNDSFIQNNQTYYQAELAALDFQQEQSVAEINKWVSEQTNHKISEIINGPIQEDTILFLINAVYFQGGWEKPFSSEQTQPAPFHLTNGTVQQVEMMKRYGSYAYMENDRLQAVQLPYVDSSLSMLILLPNQSEQLESFVQQLTPEGWTTILDSLEPTHGDLKLPKFQYNFEIQLNEALSALGMEEAFDPHASNFKQMLKDEDTRKVSLREVKHKAYIEVNEQGTEAAAVTSVEASITSAPASVFEMTVDRPFFFAIVDQETSTIIFMGLYEQPE